jgi:hypothetical protein
MRVLLPPAYYRRAGRSYQPTEIAEVPAMLPIAALAAAQAFDFVSFLAMVEEHGLAAELNPLVVAVANHFDLQGLAIVKLAMLAYVAVTIAILARRHPRLAALVITAGIAAGMLGGLSNIAST